MEKIRGRLTYANVMATVAVFIALGGVGYAAVRIPKHSVGTRQLKRNAVATGKIRRNAVTGAKVRDRSLGAVDFKAGALPAGPQGKEGPPGQRGPAGPSDLYSDTGPFVILKAGASSSDVASIVLPAGSYLVIASQTAQSSGGSGELICHIGVHEANEASLNATFTGATQWQTLAAGAAITLTETTVVTDTCSAIVNDVVLPEPEIMALKVATLH